MLSDYRQWLESELKLLGNASHHAYSFGQANMAKRAIERLDQELAGRTLVVLSRNEARSAAAALDEMQSGAALPPALEPLREHLHAGLEDEPKAAP
jgi:hypothetical protein